jgi:hypothetical protein
MTILFAALALLLSAALVRAVSQIQHTLTLNWASGTNSFNTSTILTGQEEINFSGAIAPATTNQAVPSFAFTLAKLQDVYITSDQDVTLKTNSSGSPQETLTIKAGKPFCWYKDSGVAAPFAGDVTALYVTTGAIGADANLDIRTLIQSP